MSFRLLSIYTVWGVSLVSSFKKHFDFYRFVREDVIINSSFGNICAGAVKNITHWRTDESALVSQKIFLFERIHHYT